MYKNRKKTTASPLFAILLALSLALSALPRLAIADADSADATALAAGQEAHFAQAFCGNTAQQTAQYKEQLRHVLTDASAFDANWQGGWDHSNDDIIQMRALRLSSPGDYAARVKTNCERAKWQSSNSLRPHPPK
ncbi:hypothetical protein [Paraburkholderia sp. BCC1886]|uniref:hypothetical protein n=1 Tax=Paraburkholderia sp. BCC1886 TaxID=2562670 RepID=UPI001642C1FC|nr:hypothetical protein [Paraburkholderia sp. BCC1886]